VSQDDGKPVPSVPVEQARASAVPLWKRIPRGWIILVLFLLAWLGIYLIWNGIRLVV
jgi:hypothetical protein